MHKRFIKNSGLLAWLPAFLGSKAQLLLWQNNSGATESMDHGWIGIETKRRMAHSQRRWWEIWLGETRDVSRERKCCPDLGRERKLRVSMRKLHAQQAGRRPAAWSTILHPDVVLHDLLPPERETGYSPAPRSHNYSRYTTPWFIDWRGIYKYYLSCCIDCLLVVSL